MVVKIPSVVTVVMAMRWSMVNAKVSSFDLTYTNYSCILIDIDECKHDNICKSGNSSCVNNNGGYSCYCTKDGYELKEADGIYICSGKTE